MKIKLKAFTLAELLIVLAVIGVIAVLTLTSLKTSNVDRSKALFKKSYAVAESTIGELVNDEYYYPYDPTYFGFLELTDTKIMGTNCCTSSLPGNECGEPCKKDYDSGSSDKKKKRRLIKFCNLFARTLNTKGRPDLKKIDDELICEFATSDGVEWSIVYTAVGDENDETNHDFLIRIDTNGHNKGPNSPEPEINKSSKDSESPEVKVVDGGNVKNRDLFYIYVSMDGKLRLPESDTTASKYLSSSDFGQ